MSIFDRWKKNIDYGNQWTSEEKLKEFRIPQEIETETVSGREIFRYGGDYLAVIERRGGRYYLLVNYARLTKGRDDATVSAARILAAHVAAASASTNIHLGLQNQSELSNLLTRHLDIQAKQCACSKHGFRDFSLGRLNKNGVAIIEYKCIYCGESTSFEIDHLI